MDITIYTDPEFSETCEDAKATLDSLGLTYEERALVQYVEWHPKWRDDDSVEVMAAYSALNQPCPLFCIDGVFMNAKQAMKILRNGKSKSHA